MNFIVVGHKGRLGSRIFEKAKQKHNVVGIDIGGDIFNLEEHDFDAIIDVSSAENSLKSALFAEKFNIPLVVGCTGHTNLQIEELLQKSKHIPIMICPNFSMGVCVLSLALEQILKMPITDAYITEAHHKNKKDAPSGTAKMFENMILQSKVKLHQTTSIRQNNIVGKHKIDLFLDHEHISLSHSAESIDCFANGAIFALEQIAKKKSGAYQMKDFIL